MKLFLIITSSICILFGCQPSNKKPNELTTQSNKIIQSSSQELKELASFESGNYKYSISDFIGQPMIYSLKFSPNGKFLSYKEKDNANKAHVYVKDLKTQSVIRIIEEKQNLILDYEWINNNRLIYVMDNSGDENYHLFGVDFNGEKNIDLTPYEGIQVDVINELKTQKEYMIISMNKDNPEVSEPYKINVNTGEINKLYENHDSENIIAGYDFDKDGKLKAITQQTGATDYELLYRLDETQPFKTVVQTSWKDTFNIIDFNYATKYPHDAFVLSNLKGDKDEIILYDFAEHRIIKKVFTNKNFDVGGMSQSKKRNFEVDYFSFNGIKQEIIPISSTYKKWYKGFSKKFPNKMVEIISVTDSEDKMLILVSSDRLYGIYYLYNVAENSFSEMANLKPNLIEEEMAKVLPIKFISRDGLTIHGYLTLPNILSQTKPALIVNPHGGPYGERDDWDFNTESQLLSSRGYAVLQVNYRGSGGFGKEFHMAGNKQIGRKMLDDLEDAVAYVKTLDVINSNKIAIYGASYGGLATLGSLVKTPDLYLCGVDYVGVSNLFTFFDSFPPYWKPYLKQVYEQWYDPDSKEEQIIMTQVSPALNVEKIIKPLFVVQGANDPRVNIAESNQIVKNIRGRGYDVPYMVKENEGHGFGHENNRIELYETMLGFFAKHLK